MLSIAPLVLGASELWTMDSREITSKFIQFHNETALVIMVILISSKRNGL
ncbi:hypothetical protein GCM10025855_10190 [Shewanella glacialipiscicola]|uniref:Uncharacterized protein n=1 Tax=Shewanella glacialipiscicola TaxID=614069 RepID=A0ABQ6J3P6_9GAMM|nr:hypothetical protein GCM10025855_10190 [Shewanella glacialipiscicola]